MQGYLSEKFQTHRNSEFGDITEIVTGIFVEEIGKLGIPVLEAPCTVFRKRVHWTAQLEEVYIPSQ